MQLSERLDKLLGSVLMAHLLLNKNKVDNINATRFKNEGEPEVQLILIE